MTLPKTQRAVLGRLPTAGQGALLCADNHPIPTIEDDRVLVKAHHVALNPYDWKGVRYKFALKEVAAVMGRDGSGVVVSVGDKVKLFEPGDRVWFCSNVAFPTSAAFQEFSVHSEYEIGRVPDSLSLASAATLGTGYLTAAVTLFRTLGRSLVELSQPHKRRLGEPPEWILIRSGASSTGVYLIQLAKLIGLRVITTASTQNHEYLRHLGADVVIDRSLSLEEQLARIRRETEDEVRKSSSNDPYLQVLLAVDNVGPKTSAACHKVLRGSRRHRQSRMSPVSASLSRKSSSASLDLEDSCEPARLVSLAGTAIDESDADDDAVRPVDDVRISFSTTFYGQEDWARELMATTNDLLQSGRIQPSRFDFEGFSLGDIEAALGRLERGETRSGHKSVIQIIADSPPSPPNTASEESVPAKLGRKRELKEGHDLVEHADRPPKRREKAC